MKLKNLINLTILCTTIPHAYTMESLSLEKTKKTERITHTPDYECGYFKLLPIENPLFSQQPHYDALPKHELQLKLPNDILDKIIAYSSHNARRQLKETCKQLSILTSINRLNEFTAHDFNIGDEKEKEAFFSALIKTSNPDLITTIMRYAKQEAELYNFVLEDAVCIDFESTTCTQRYIREHYLDPLLKKAIKQNKYHSVDTLIKNSSGTIHDNYNYLEYAAEYDSDNAIRALFDCNAFDAEQLVDALNTAGINNKRKALELLSEKTGDYEYLDTLKEERCTRIKALIYMGTMITVLMTGVIGGITLQILGHYRHYNGTIH